MSTGGNAAGYGHGKWLDGLSAAFRDARNQSLRAFIEQALAMRQQSGQPSGGAFRILDLGGTFAYWKRVGLDFLQRNDITVTCINATASELGADAAGGGAPAGGNRQRL